MSAQYPITPICDDPRRVKSPEIMAFPQLQLRALQDTQQLLELNYVIAHMLNGHKELIPVGIRHGRGALILSLESYSEHAVTSKFVDRDGKEFRLTISPCLEEDPADAIEIPIAG